MHQNISPSFVLPDLRVLLCFGGGLLRRITDDPEAAVSQADLVMVAAPAHVHLDLLKKVVPYLKPGCVLGTLFGQGATTDIQN